MEGYNCEEFSIKKPPNSLKCLLCNHILRNPHFTDCCEAMVCCQPCFERYLSGGPKPCHCCSGVVFPMHTLPHNDLRNEVNALGVRCPLKKRGCEWKGKLGKVERHLSECGFVKVKCRFECRLDLERRMVEEHERESCPNQSIATQVATLMEKLEKIAEENTMLKQQCLTQQEQIDDLWKCVYTRQLPVMPFFFTLPNFEHHQKNGLVYHESFYSHPGGLKMTVTVYTNGLMEYQHENLCLTMCVHSYSDSDPLSVALEDGSVILTAEVQTRHKIQGKEQKRYETINAGRNKLRVLQHSKIRNYCITIGGGVRFRIGLEQVKKRV